MSSTYRRICLSHEPPLLLDTYEDNIGATVPPQRPADHPNCQIGLGRFSYPLISMWLPGNRGNDGWIDTSWLRQFPNMLRFLEQHT